MLLQHFKLREQPFGVTPDPRYFYASATHREALSALLYGIESNLGFLALIAKPGMGKTTLLFDVLSRVGRGARTVFIFQTISTPEDLFRALLIDLGVVDLPSSLVDMQTRLNELLMAQAAQGRPLIVAIDEAQNLNESVLEALRMLSNFETSTRKLVQIILSGQLQLAEKLTTPSMLQLRQRISIFAYLRPMTVEETSAYIQHRLELAGSLSKETLFSRAAIEMIGRHSEGIPRNINNICFNALSLACAIRANEITPAIIQEVIADLAPISEPSLEATSPAIQEVPIFSSSRFVETPSKSRAGLTYFAVAACLALLFGTWFAIRNRTSPPPTPLAAPKSLEAPSTPSTRVQSAENLNPAPYTIQIHEGQSLYGICSRSYGDCQPNRLKEIIRLNPRIANPNHIEAGQTIFLPAPVSSSTTDK